MITDDKIYAQTLIDRGIDISRLDIKGMIEAGVDISQEAIDKAVAYFNSFLKKGDTMINRYGKVIGITDDWILCENSPAPRRPRTLIERWEDECRLDEE